MCVCVCVCVCVCTHTHTHTHSHVYTYIHYSLIFTYSDFQQTNFGLLKLKALFRESFVTSETNGQRSQLISQTLKSVAGLCCCQNLRACLAGLCIFRFDEISSIAIATCGFTILRRIHNFPHTP